MNEEQAKRTEANWQYTGKQDSYDGGQVGQRPAGVPLPSLPDIEWSASEYVAHSKSIRWYIKLVAGGAMLVAVILLITRDIFASVAVFLAFLTLGAYAGRPPATKKYVLSEDGIAIDGTNFHYDSFKSFSVVEEGGIDSVWLKPLKRFSPMLVMYFSPEDESKIVDMIANFLPHEQRELDVIDKLSRHMRF